MPDPSEWTARRERAAVAHIEIDTAVATWLELTGPGGYWRLVEKARAYTITAFNYDPEECACGDDAA